MRDWTCSGLGHACCIRVSGAKLCESTTALVRCNNILPDRERYGKLANLKLQHVIPIYERSITNANGPTARNVRRESHKVQPMTDSVRKGSFSRTCLGMPSASPYMALLSSKRCL